jgi:hypothetical protein
MRKNSYSLGIHPASYYASLFDAAKITIKPAGNGPRQWPECGVAIIGKGDLEFEIVIPTEEGRVPEKLVSITRSVLSQVVEMDDAARAGDDAGPLHQSIDEDEVLAYVVIRDAYVEFSYFATTVNTEWSIYFTPNGQGDWDYRGFQPPRPPR